MMRNKCYAHRLGNCSGGSSREHYISDGLLKSIGSTLEISGLSWLQGKTKKLPSSALTSKILCKHHNNMLAELDSEAIKFFNTLLRFDKELSKVNLKDNDETFFRFSDGTLAYKALPKSSQQRELKYQASEC